MNMNEFQNFMQSFQQFRQNPSQYMINHGIDKSIANNPQAIIQQMMKDGRLSQQQYNAAYRMANQLKDNPMFNFKN